jgi:hypothetical protein
MTTKPIPTIDTSQAVEITSIEQLNSLEPGFYLDPIHKIIYEFLEEDGHLNVNECTGDRTGGYSCKWLDLDSLLNAGTKLLRLSQ